MLDDDTHKFLGGGRAGTISPYQGSSVWDPWDWSITELATFWEMWHKHAHPDAQVALDAARDLGLHWTLPPVWCYPSHYGLPFRVTYEGQEILTQWLQKFIAQLPPNPLLAQSHETRPWHDAQRVLYYHNGSNRNRGDLIQAVLPVVLEHLLPWESGGDGFVFPGHPNEPSWLEWALAFRTRRVQNLSTTP